MARRKDTNTLASSHLIGQPLEPMRFEYSERDVILYALGVGCGPADLLFTYEYGLRALPTFSVIPPFPALLSISRLLGLDPQHVIHTEQRIDLYAPIPTSGSLITVPTIEGVYDKTRGALVAIRTETADKRGDILFRCRFGLFVPGRGGFSGVRGPMGPRNLPPLRAPDCVVEKKTLPEQALLYRLSGDWNPIHADPAVAQKAGFHRPILHGLCSFGIVGRAILETFAHSEPHRLKALEARFSGVVYPSETIVTEMWDEGYGRVVARATTRERQQLVVGSIAASIRP